MSSVGVSTTIEQDNRHSALIFRAVTRRRLAGITFQLRETELRATDEGLTATGDLGGHKAGMLHLKWSRIRELHFAPSCAGETGGLYAREGAHCSRCLLPRITETQTGQLLASLISRFPAPTSVVQIDREAANGVHLLGHSL